MINFAMEIPIANLKDFAPLEDFHFCIASTAAAHGEYRDYYRWLAQRSFVMLDNGAYEDHAGGYSAVTADELWSLANYIKPNVVWAPDLMFDKVATEQLSLDFKMLCERRGRSWQIGFIPQGVDAKDIITSYTSYYHYFEWIGLSFLNPRQEVMDGLGSLSYQRPLHMLGLVELRDIVKWPGSVISMDTSKPIKAAIQGVTLEKLVRGTYMKPTDICSNIWLAKDNIDILREWCNVQRIPCSAKERFIRG
jgi:hypothetical protein